MLNEFFLVEMFFIRSSIFRGDYQYSDLTFSAFSFAVQRKTRTCKTRGQEPLRRTVYSVYADSRKTGHDMRQIIHYYLLLFIDGRTTQSATTNGRADLANHSVIKDYIWFSAGPVPHYSLSCNFKLVKFSNNRLFPRLATAVFLLNALTVSFISVPMSEPQNLSPCSTCQTNLVY